MKLLPPLKYGAIRIAGIYVLISMLWITFSDRVLFHLAAGMKEGELLLLSSAKGYVFVLANALYLYFLIRSDSRKLLEDESQYRGMYEANPVPMWIYDEKLRIISLNDAAVAGYGYSREEFLSKTILDIRPAEDVEKVLESVNKVGTNLNSSGTWRHIRKDGTILFVKIISHRVLFNNKPGVLVMASDMTELVMMQQQLEKVNRQLTAEKAKLKETQLISRVAGWEFYPATQELIFSDELYQITGLQNDGHQAAFDVYIDHIFPEDRQLMLQGLEALIRDGAPIDVTHRIHDLDGNTRYIRQLAHMEPGSEPLKLVGSMQDITELKLMEDEKKRYQQHLELTLDTISDAYFALDRDMVIIRYNQAFREIIGDLGEIMGVHIFTVFPKAKNNFYKSYQKALEDRVIVRAEAYSLVLEKWIRLVAYPTDEGVAVYFSDITANRLRDEKLKETLERYELVTQATSDVVYDLNIKDNLIVYNSSLSKLIALPYEAIEYDLGWWRGLIHPDDLPEVVDSQQRISGQGKTNWSCEYRVYCGNDYYKYVSDQGYFIYNEQMEPLRLIGVIQDIDELKRSLQENKRQNELLKEVAWQGSHQIRKPVATMLGLMNLAALAENEKDKIELFPMLEVCVKEMDEIVIGINERVHEVITPDTGQIKVSR